MGYGATRYNNCWSSLMNSSYADSTLTLPLKGGS
jgi:hypothetical protein